MDLRDARIEEASVEGAPGSPHPGPDDAWTVRVVAELGDSWRVTWAVTTQGARPVLAAISLEPTGALHELEPGGLPGRALRELSVPRLIAIAARLVEREAAGDETGTLARFGPYLRRKPIQRRPGRRPVDDLRYAELAARYVALVRAGNRAPIKAIAEEQRDPGGLTFIRDQLAEARRRGLLERPVGGPGTIGGQLTEKAEAVLAEAKTKPPRRRQRPGA